MNNLESPSPKDVLCQVLVEIGSVVLEKKIFQISQCILKFRNYLPLEKAEALHLKKLESPYPRMLIAKFG